MMAGWDKDPKSKPSTNKSTGKPIKSRKDLESVAYAICTKSVKMHEQQTAEMEVGGGPALVAVAVTAKPHLRQRGMEIELVERNGKEMVRVPLFKKGIYRHPNGTLLFDDGFIDKMITNYQAKVTDYPPILDFRHDDKLGALAFLDPDDGGELVREEDKVVAYGVPTDEQAKEIVKSRKWRYASPEFYKNYRSNLVQKLSAETLEEIQLEDILEVNKMPKQVKFGDVLININEDDGVFALGESDVANLEKIALEFDGGVKAKNKVVELEAKVKELTPKTEPDLSPEAKIKLEAMQSELATLKAERDAEKLQRTREQVAVALEKAKAYRDSNGNAHAPVFLNLVEKGMLLEEFENGDAKYTLEAKDATDAAKVIAHYRNLFKVMLETCPGTMPATGHTEGSDNQPGQAAPTYSKEELEEALKEFHEKF